ncbi:ABC transporter permease [Pedobacter antarcticus]|uniref:ABC transporter permease n=1 Tax=Pedobacter antarcticus TaxID=34086 RepID=UPI00292EC36F|nr:ABC transporter permease [Pedobacter antarcticus]
MFTNYLKLGFRNLKKYKLSSFINISGLALAVGCCIMVSEYTYWALHQDSFNSRIDRLFVVEKVVTKKGVQQIYGDVPAPLAQSLKNDYPQVVHAARLNYRSVVIKQDENVFRDKLTFVDDDFYKMFDYPVKWGQRQQFTDKDGIVLTQELSNKLFGTNNSVGKVVTIRINRGDSLISENFIVKGVLQKYPVEASFNFSALVPYSRMSALGLDKPGNWAESTSITFVEMNDAKDIALLKSQGKRYSDLYNAANQNSQVSSFHYQHLNTMNFHSYKVTGSYFNTMQPIGLIMLIVIALSILLLVYFNYINITIASVSGRLKEISVRKVMGSSKGQIILQFVTENLIICTIAVFFGLLLAEVFFFPWFSSISGFQLGNEFFLHQRTWIAALLLILISALSGATYPAFYIYSLSTVGMMKGNVKMGSKNRFRKVLLAFQFFLTFMAISTAIAFVKETNAIKSRPWGYQPENNVVVNIDNSISYNSIREQLKRNKKIESVAGSVESMGNFTREIMIKADTETETVKSLSVLPGFTEHLGINITSGRGFNEKFPADQQNAVIVNQAFLKMMNWSSGIGKKIVYNSRNYVIVGEVNDFRYESFEYQVAPLVLMNCKPEDVRFIYIKYAPGLFSNAQLEIKGILQKIYPYHSFEYYYQDQVFNGYFTAFSTISKLLGVTSLFMTLISISGVFGLALIILGKKMKEISVRKVLGADMIHIIYLIVKEFFFALVAAIAIGLPLSYIMMTSMFNQLSVNSQFSALPVLMAVIILLFITAISVSWHILKAYKANISPYLKDE